MEISPRYDGPPIISIDGDPGDVSVPLVRQRRRFADLLEALQEDQWRAPSRCAGWSVQDVVAHLVGVDQFWLVSTLAGVAGSPTRYLAGFDPAATPAQMVEGMRSLAPADVLEQYLAANAGFLDAVADLDDAGWSATAESPAGHVSVRLIAAHALWDCWIHERDVALPLGLTPAVEDDEVLVCLRYAAALSPAFAVSTGTATVGAYVVEASDPDHAFVLDVDEVVAVRDRSAPSGAPVLRGPAVELVEALSIRTPLPATTPPEWHRLLEGLAWAFDTQVATAP